MRTQSSYHLCDSAREEAEREKEAERRPNEEGLLTPDELRVYIQCAQKLKPLLTGKTFVTPTLSEGQTRVQDTLDRKRLHFRCTYTQIHAPYDLSRL